MTTIRPRLFALALAAATPLACVPTATAQVPLDTAVVGTFSGPASAGTSGLFLLPLSGGALTPISNLPIELQQATSSYQRGVGSVDVRSADGAIVCGSVAAASGPGQGAIHLFVLHLNGTAVDSSQTLQIWLGNTVNVGGAAARMLPDGRILVLASDGAGALTSGPMANHVAAIVDVSQPSPTVTPLPQLVGTGVGGGIAIDPAGKFAYYLLTTNPGSATSVAGLFRWEMSSGQSCMIASWTGHVAQGVCCGDDGTVYVSTNDTVATIHYAHTVEADGCNGATVTSVASTLALPAKSLRLDAASGQFVTATAGWAPGFPNHRNSVANVDPVTGLVTMLATGPASGWGMMSDVALRRPMVSYGTCSDGQNRYSFDNFPNPGGQPTIGNGSFSLTMRASASGALLSLLGLSLRRDSVPVVGIELLLDPGLVVTTVIPAGSTATHNLPIPSDPSFAGLSLMAQTLHLESTGVAASRGLQVTIR